MRTQKKDFIKVPWVFWKNVSRVMDYIEGFIFLYLAQYCYGAKDECYPTQQTIAQDTGIPLVTVKRRIEAMTIRGVIEIVSVQRGGKGKWNTYRLTDWYKLAELDDWRDTAVEKKKMVKEKKEAKESKKLSETSQSITEQLTVVSQRAIKKSNSIRLNQEDKLVAEATRNSDSFNATVSSGNRGVAPMYDTNGKGNHYPKEKEYLTTRETDAPAAQSHDDYLADKKSCARLNGGRLSDDEAEAFDLATEEKNQAEADAQQRKMRKTLTIAELIAEEVNPVLDPIPSDSTDLQVKNAIWKHFQNRGDSIKYKNKLYTMEISKTATYYDPIDASSLLDKEVLIRAHSMLKEYWIPEYWHGDGSLMMFLLNFQKFYSNVTTTRWYKLSEYCRENTLFLARKYIRERKLLSLTANKEEVMEILASGIELTEIQRGYLESDPEKLEYNQLASLKYKGKGTGDLIRPEDQHEISIETMVALYIKMKSRKNDHILVN